MSDHKKATVVAEPGKQEIIVTREFDAPRELVFKAFTDKDLYAQWMGPRGYEVTLERFEPHSGGSWRYIHTDKEGNTFAFHGVNHLVKAPEIIVGTFEYEGMPEEGHVLLETGRFEELPGGRTRFVGKSVFQSVEDRDGMIQSGMEGGMQESYERLDEVLEKIK